MKLKSTGGKCFLLPENVSTSNIMVNPLHAANKNTMSNGGGTNEDIESFLGRDSYPHDGGLKCVKDTFSG